MSGKPQLTRFQTSAKIAASPEADYSSARTLLKPAAARDAAPSSPTKSTPKLGQLGKSATVAGSTGFRRGGAAAGPSSSSYTQADLDRNTTEGVYASQGLDLPTQQRPQTLGLSKAAADEFVDAGTKPGLEIWRIEELIPVPWPEELYGKFCSGDSYIVLHSQEVKGKMVYHIHFWLGTDSTVDETGAAAYKVVELTEKLGGEAPQHREVQEHEGTLFLSYFPGGIEYLSGGVESAFQHVERDIFKTRLLHLKGKRQVRIKQVPLTYKSLNDGDVFVLDEGLKLHLWNGRNSSRLERTKGANVVQAIKDNERAGRAKIIILDQEDENEMMVQPDWKAFWDAMGGRGPVKSDDEVEDDAAAEKQLVADIKLFRVSDASGQLQITEVETRPLSKKLLDPMDAFILDCQTEIFAWVGKGATQLEKNEAVTYARKFLVKLNRPLWTPITRILEGSETTVFKEKFSDWPDTYDARVNFSKLALLSKLVQNFDDEADAKIDVKGLHRRQTLGSSNNRNTMLSLSQVVRLTFDDISGNLKGWVVEGNTKLLLSSADLGQLYEGNIYLLQYTYHAEEKGKREHVVMTWMGRTASAWERELAVEQAKTLAKELGGNTAVVNFVQGKEEEKFLDLFGGHMVIRRGEQDTRRRLAFRVHHTLGFAETVCVCGSIPALGDWNIEKALALTPKENDMHWGTLILPQDMNELEYKAVIVNEDKKKEPRWESGGNAKLRLKPNQQNTVVEIEFDQRDQTACVELPETPKPTVSLFHIKGTNALNTRAIQVPEQTSSLNSGDAFVLISPAHFYIWYGRGCNEGERKYALMVANLLKPAKYEPSIERVDEGQEPDHFWTLLGGKGTYAASESLQAQQDLPPARLFHCSNASGKFQVDEIDPFSQDDLFEDDVMILDAFTEVYVWMGSGSNEVEKKRGYETARKYVRAAEDGRPANTPVLKVYAGDEPASFIAHFHAWRKDHVDAYTQKLREMQLLEVDEIQRGKEKIQTTQEYTQEFEKARPKAIVNEDGTLSPNLEAAEPTVQHKGSISAIDSSLRESQGSPLMRRETALRLGAEKMKHQSQEEAAAIRRQRETEREEKERNDKERHRREAEEAAIADKIRREAERKAKEEREERERIQREKDEKERKERERVERAERARQEAILAAQMEEQRLARLTAAAKQKEEEEAAKAKAEAEEAAQRAREAAELEMKAEATRTAAEAQAAARAAVFTADTPTRSAPSSSSAATGSSPRVSDSADLDQKERMELLRKRREERLEAERLAREAVEHGKVVVAPEQVKEITDVDHLAEQLRREKQAAAEENKAQEARAASIAEAEEAGRREARAAAARAEAEERTRRENEERAQREKRDREERAQREAKERKEREEREERERRQREERAERAKQEAILAARAAGEAATPTPAPAPAAHPAPAKAPVRAAPEIALAAAPTGNRDPALAAELKAAGVHRFYCWEELHSNGSLHRPPPDVDETRLEAYLCDAEFKNIFKMTRQQFYAQKEWAIRAQKMKWKLW